MDIPVKGISHQLSRAPEGDLGPPEDIEPIFPEGREPTLAAWESQRRSITARWAAALRTPTTPATEPPAELIRTFDRPEYRATVYRQPTGLDAAQTLLLMEPRGDVTTRRPGMVVPYYHPDQMAGFDLETHQPIEEAANVQFGRHLVQQGYVVVCTNAFPYYLGPVPGADSRNAWLESAIEKLRKEWPACAGIAKRAWDASRALGFLLSRPDVDPRRVGIMGHSLGGKVAFYTGALDERVKAVVSSDFGIGLSFSNWDAPWILGDQIHRPGFALGHHQLLALIAPRPFLLFGGQADRPASWQYILEAQKVYALYGARDAVGFLHHGAGHRPTEESLRVAYRWLSEQFGIPENPWNL